MNNYLPLKKYIRTNPSDSKSSLRLCSNKEKKGNPKLQNKLTINKMTREFNKEFH